MSVIDGSSQMRIYEDDYVSAYLNNRPIIKGDVTVLLKNTGLDTLSKELYVQTFVSARKLSLVIKTALSVKRVALATTGGSVIRLFPLHGLQEHWEPTTNPDTVYFEKYPGYITSKSGERRSDEELNKIQSQIVLHQTSPLTDHSFFGQEGRSSLFGRIVRGEEQQWRIWENPGHVAFLTPFPNSPGFTVLVPRKYQSSEILNLETQNFVDLVSAAYDVSALLKKAFDTTRVGIMFEGMEINYAHVKLIPILGKDQDTQYSENYSDFYKGSISTECGPIADKELLSETKESILNALNI